MTVAILAYSCCVLAKVLQGMTSGVSKIMFMCGYCQLQNALTCLCVNAYTVCIAAHMRESGKEEQGGT